ncbi:MAG: DeoR/GlpR family DNA-binding transcription regulator [Flexilinea sp.]
MIPYERQKLILNEFANKEIISLEELGKILSGVSASTIRRDLKTLSEKGLIELLQGGAAKIITNPSDTPINTRSTINIRAKERIAKCAASFVNDGDVIYIDSGTTPLKMINYLQDKKIAVVTTNTLLLAELEGTKIACTVVGGEVNIETASILGPVTDSTLRDMYFDKAFLGTSGCDLVAGINTPDSREASKKKIVKKNSKMTYILADSSKMGVVTMCKAFELNECLIISEEECDLLRKHARYIIAN